MWPSFFRNTLPANKVLEYGNHLCKCRSELTTTAKKKQKGKETNVAGGKRPLIERSDPSGENVFSVEKPTEDAEPLEVKKFQIAIAEL